jgi:hypothetical protein
MPKLSWSTFARGATELVVQDPLENTSDAVGSRFASLTPSTKVGTSPLAGAEMITFLAPPLRWASAFGPSAKNPVDSITTSAPTEPHGMAAGSRWANTLRMLSPIVMVSPSTPTPSRCPEMESHSRSVASVAASVMSLTATTSMSASLASAARR